MTSATTVRLPTGSPVRAEGWDLIEDVQNGNIGSFGVLYERYVDSVLGYVRSRVVDRAYAEDLTSETFLKVLARVGSFADRGTSVRALLFTIARNLVLDHAKSKYSRSVVVNDELIHDARSTHEDVETLVIRDHQLADLAVHFPLLTRDQRECVVSRFILGLSVAETAVALRRDVRAVRQLQYRAIQRLSDLMREEWA